jgi:8-oxo-dGTP pyrophosphatase MutT (NUDIX family)
MDNNEISNKKFWAGVILFNPKTNEVLLHKRDPNILVNPDMWGFFGGVGEAGETPEECVVREVKEELNTDILAKNLTPFVNYLNDRRQTWHHTFTMDFNLPKSQMTLGEGAGFDWININDAFKLDLSDKTRLDLEKFYNQLSK